MTDEVCKLCAQSVEAHRLGHYCGMFVTDEDPRTKALRTRIAELEGALRPFVALADQRDARYRRRGGDPSIWRDDSPACGIKAAELPNRVWRNARATLNGEKKDG